MKSLENKVAIVTGAGSGIGREIAIKYAEEGAKVVVADIDEKGGNETVSLIKKNGGDVIFIKADSSNAENNHMLVEETVKHFGALHIACNNAGIGGEQNLTADYSVEGWQKVIAINLSGIFYCMKYEIPAMLKAGAGAIVNMASILGQVGFTGAPAYVAAKHGVIGLTKNAAIDYAAKGIRVNSIGPAFIRTPMIASLEENADALNMLIGLHPMGRLGLPEEVAELVIWLSSKRASFVTGAYYSVDGGYLAR